MLSSPRCRLAARNEGVGSVKTVESLCVPSPAWVQTLSGKPGWVGKAVRISLARSLKSQRPNFLKHFRAPDHDAAVWSADAGIPELHRRVPLPEPASPPPIRVETSVKNAREVCQMVRNGARQTSPGSSVPNSQPRH